MVDLALGGVLHGTVRYEDTGRPARRIAILCRNWAGAHLSAETLTDEEGHYRLEGVSFSTRSQIVVSSPGYVQKDFRQKAPTAEQLEVELDIDLIPTAAFRGQVLGPGGGPAKGVMVEAFAVVESPPESTALRWRREALRQSPLLTDEAGRFALEDIPPHGKLFIWAYHPDLGEAILGPEAWPLPAPEPPSDLRIELSGGAGLRVKVVDMQGNPIDGAVVLPAMVEFPDLEPRGMSTLMFFSQRTSLDVMRAEQRSGIWPGSRVGHAGSDGVCEWKDLVPGKCRVSVTTPSGDGAAGGYWIYTAKTAEALSPGATLSVSVALDLTHQLKG